MAKPKPAESESEPVTIPSSEEPPAAIEPEAGPPPEPAPRPVMDRRPTIAPMLAGGALAAALGFGGALFLATTYPETLGIAGASGVDERLSSLTKRVEDLAAAVAAGGTDAAATESVTADLDALRSEASGVARNVDALTKDVTARFGGLDKRVAALESVPTTPGGLSAAEVAAQTQAAKEAEAEAEKLRAEAEALARAANARAALAEVEAALESGIALEPALARLSDAGVTVPETLGSQGQGVPTLMALRATFPAAARDALATSLGEAADGSAWDRFTAFLRSQTGARSLTPRAGDDPDAVLSRAEAALGTGDLKAALAEISALPPGGQARMAEWIGLAERRLSAADAIAALAAQIE